MHISNIFTKNKTIALLVLAVILLLLLYLVLVRTNSNLSNAEVVKTTSLSNRNADPNHEFKNTRSGESSTYSPDGESNGVFENSAANRIARPTFENTLISGNGLNSKSIYSTIESDRKFSDAMSKLRSEAFQDSDTLELTQRYNRAINSLESVNKNIKLNDFVCGSTICMGSLHETAIESGWEDWLTNFESNRNAPHYAIIDTTINLGNGQYEHRIVTSINKDVPGIVSRK